MLLGWNSQDSGGGCELLTVTSLPKIDSTALWQLVPEVNGCAGSRREVYAVTPVQGLVTLMGLVFVSPCLPVGFENVPWENPNQ